MHVEFESDFKNKVLFVYFTQETEFKSAQDVLQWRTLWVEQLKKWHTPYKALVSFEHVLFLETDEIKDALKRMFKFLGGLFLKKICGFPASLNAASWLPFELFEDKEKASQALGIRAPKDRTPDNFRSSIQFDNHFSQHIVELSFLQNAVFDSEEKVRIFKEKTLNNLLLWHSSWNLLIDCEKFSIEGDRVEDFTRVLNFFKSFFLKQVIGYQFKGDKETAPFQVVRTRHHAMVALKKLESEPLEAVNCQTGKNK